MNSIFSRFEKAGLKIDHDRVLTYSQLSCPFNCRYCFVGDMNFNQHRNVSYLTDKQLLLIEQLPKNINLIMLGCDTEFFQNQNEAIKILNLLISTHKNISLVTKFALNENLIKKLKKIDDKLKKNNNFLTLSISLTSLESATKWEPRVPSPKLRIMSLKKAYLSGIKTLVALRPLLPDITIQELTKIIDNTSKYCYGYYSGPLYLKEIKENLIGTGITNELSIEKIQPHWMPHGNKFYKIEKIGQMDILIELIKAHNKDVFSGAADVIKHINYHEKH